MTSDEKKLSDDSHHPSLATQPFLGLPHRPPFVFVQKLNACQPGVFAECETCFALDDPMFAGHFPDKPLVPGVILTEALAQTAGIAAASDDSSNAKPRFLLSAIRKMKFSGAVRPGETIVLRAEKIATMNDNFQFNVEACVGGKRVATGEIVLSRERSS